MVAIVKKEKTDTDTMHSSSKSSKHHHGSSSSKRTRNDSDSSGEESDSRPLKSTVSSTHREIKKEPRGGHDSDGEMKIHVKKINGFDKNHSNTAEDDRAANKQKELATDVKSKEATESGAFENFDLPSNLVEKLKGKGITYLYPIQVATLKHIRKGYDMIAQARTGTGKTVN
jgi:superfamily II RNA helicase